MSNNVILIFYQKLNLMILRLNEEQEKVVKDLQLIKKKQVNQQLRFVYDLYNAE